MPNSKPPFDPSYGYNLDQLLAIETPAAPSEFAHFWQNTYQAVLKTETRPTLSDTGRTHKHWRIFHITYHSANNVLIGGWLLLPLNGAPKRGFIVGHGYGGRDNPDFHLPFADSVILFPCCRGISLSPHPPISNDPKWHVLHDIDKKRKYIMRGCVEDTWLAVSSLLALFPYLSGKLGYLGISFSGGIGALALAWDQRIARAHFNVPTFGHHRLRLRLPTWGSGHSVQAFYQKHPKTVLKTLRYYDAANAAEHINIPIHCALALKDPIVAPPGQFAIYNALQCQKQLFVLEQGHADYPNKQQQDKALLKELKLFFEPLY